MDIKKEFYNKLPDEKIKINGNKNLIKMKLFLSFLTVPVIRSTKHLGSGAGWTYLENKEHKLHIHGGIVNNIEYLDSLKFGKNLSNSYNDFVNPFFLWQILNDDGRKFFVDYYMDDIKKIIAELDFEIECAEIRLTNLKSTFEKIVGEKNILENCTVSTIFSYPEEEYRFPFFTTLS